MSTFVPIVGKVPTSSLGAGVSSWSYSGLAPDVYRQLCHRLAWLGAIYACVAFALKVIDVVGYFVAGIAPPSPVELIATAMGVAFGSAVFVYGRTDRIPPTAFGTVAVAVAIVATFGSAAPAWGWEHELAAAYRTVAETLGFGGGRFEAHFMPQLIEANLRILSVGNVLWIALWIVIFPLLLPLSLGRTTVVCFGSASVVPAVLGASLLAHGVPPTLEAWAGLYVLDATIPVFVVAGVAVAASRVVVRLTQQLSKARQMGSYRLTEKIGEGGMGEVWHAEHRMLARPAAIKLIRSERLGLADQDAAATALRRFEREAQVIATLKSPHTVELYDFGVTDDGVLYYVMELLDGLDLKTLVEQYGPVPQARAVSFLRQVCRSLREAHDRGLVHRDIKPANIFTCRLGSEIDFIKVLDFGLVKESRDPESGAHQLTTEGLVAGTPAFMPPEMARAERDLDGRTDIYQLGCVGFWLTTGQLVFSGATIIDLVGSHLHKQPPSVSSRSPTPISEGYDRLIHRCLEKDPANRPQTAKELDERLNDIERADGRWTPDDAMNWWAQAAGQHRGRPTV